MAQYRKRPIVVDAEWMSEPFLVETLEGCMQGPAGDYLITGVEGEQYPCAASVFEATYDKVEEEDGRNTSKS